METKSIKVFKDEFEKYDQRLLDNGFTIVHDSNPYLYGKYKKNNVHVLVYSSGKVVLQGDNLSNVLELFSYENDNEAKEFNIDNNDKISIKADKSGSTSVTTFVPHIGADEVGKGDFFGPLIVCVAYVTDENVKLLRQLGVADSKKLSDKRIAEIYNLVQERILYRVEVLMPLEYNERVAKLKNIALVLAQLHGDNIKAFIEDLKEKGIEYDKVVIDQFSSDKGRLSKHLSNYNMEQFHQAESKDITVAMASIIARYYFIKSMRDMSDKYEIEFPFGASHVIDTGKEFIKIYGTNELINVAKLNFKTVNQL